MWMSIDEIEQWEKKNKTVKVPEEKWLLAQEIMHKYQKIEDIYYHQSGEALENSLRAVIEDDNSNTGSN